VYACGLVDAALAHLGEDVVIERSMKNGQGRGHAFGWMRGWAGAGLFLVAVAGCAPGIPPGFAKGTHWSFPVLGGLEQGPLAAPVMINGKGPYLFLLNPGGTTTIDPTIVRDQDLFIVRTNGKLTDQTDRISHEQIEYVDIATIGLGDLTVSNRRVLVLATNSRLDGRVIHGTLGEEVFEDTLIWTFDRDRQMVYLMVQGKQPVLPHAQRVSGDVLDGRFFVEARLNGRETARLAASWTLLNSALWPRVAADARLSAVAQQGEVGVAAASQGWVAQAVKLDDLAAEQVQFVEFRDRRVRETDYDGILGADFFSRYRTTVNWHREALWLEPRDERLAERAQERVRRWGPTLDRCKTRACVVAQLVDTPVGPPAPGQKPATVQVLQFVREPWTEELHFDVQLEAVDDRGEELALPRLTVVFPKGVGTVSVGGEGAQVYSGAAEFQVVDATPYPPPCPPDKATAGCVFLVN
jgi:hypothetical protein